MSKLALVLGTSADEDEFLSQLLPSVKSQDLGDDLRMARDLLSNKKLFETLSSLVKHCGLLAIKTKKFAEFVCPYSKLEHDVIENVLQITPDLAQQVLGSVQYIHAQFDSINETILSLQSLTGGVKNVSMSNNQCVTVHESSTPKRGVGLTYTGPTKPSSSFGEMGIMSHSPILSRGRAVSVLSDEQNSDLLDDNALGQSFDNAMVNMQENSASPTPSDGSGRLVLSNGTGDRVMDFEDTTQEDRDWMGDTSVRINGDARIASDNENISKVKSNNNGLVDKLKEFHEVGVTDPFVFGGNNHPQKFNNLQVYRYKTPGTKGVTLVQSEVYLPINQYDESREKVDPPRAIVSGRMFNVNRIQPGHVHMETDPAGAKRIQLGEKLGNKRAKGDDIVKDGGCNDTTVNFPSNSQVETIGGCPPHQFSVDSVVTFHKENGAICPNPVSYSVCESDSNSITEILKFAPGEQMSKQDAPRSATYATNQRDVLCVWCNGVIPPGHFYADVSEKTMHFTCHRRLGDYLSCNLITENIIMGNNTRTIAMLVSLTKKTCKVVSNSNQPLLSNLGDILSLDEDAISQRTAGKLRIGTHRANTCKTLKWEKIDTSSDCVACTGKLPAGYVATAQGYKLHFSCALYVKTNTLALRD